MTTVLALILAAVGVYFCGWFDRDSQEADRG